MVINNNLKIMSGHNTSMYFSTDLSAAHHMQLPPWRISTPKLTEYIQKSHILNKVLGVHFV